MHLTSLRRKAGSRSIGQALGYSGRSMGLQRKTPHTDGLGRGGGGRSLVRENPMALGRDDRAMES